MGGPETGAESACEALVDSRTEAGERADVLAEIVPVLVLDIKVIFVGDFCATLLQLLNAKAVRTNTASVGNRRNRRCRDEPSMFPQVHYSYRNEAVKT